jgi:DNA-binding winged helix-turn-helix (wHTH) protein/tetratricopeptide (TPR) repeat protein
MTVPAADTSYSRIRFGDFEADLRTGELRKFGTKIKIQDRPFLVLSILAERPGEIVTREELRARLWPADTFVDFDHGVASAVNRLRVALCDDAAKPRYIETVGRRGYRIVVPVTATASTQASAVAVSPEAAASPSVAERPSVPVPVLPLPATVPSRHIPFWLRLLSVPAVLALFALAYYLMSGRLTPGSAAVHPRRSVAVLGFKNLSGQPAEAWLSTAFSEMLITELSAGGKLRLVPGQEVTQARNALRIEDPETLSRDILQRLHHDLGADMVVFGSYAVVPDTGGGKIRLDLRLQDTSDGETVGSVAETGSQSNLFELVSSAGSAMRAKLGAGDPGAGEEAKARATLPTDPQAARYYAEGLDKLRMFEAQAARDLFEKAVAADPGNAAAHSALADAWAALGFDTTAQEQARQALDLSAGLSREEQMSIEARYRMFTHDWPRAIDNYHTLIGFFPDNLGYGLKLVKAQIAAGHGQDALAVIATMRKLPPPLSQDLRIDIAEADVASALGDFKRDQSLAESVERRARAASANLLLADVLRNDAWASERLGQYDRSLAASGEAKSLYALAGDRSGAAAAQLFAGDVMYDRGNYPAALQQFEQALAAFRAVGSQRGTAQSLERVGNTFYEQGKLAEADATYQQALKIDREIRLASGIASDLGNIANVLMDEGDLVKARAAQEDALAAFRQTGDKRGIASTQGNLGNVLLEMGDLAGARRQYDESLAIKREISYRRGEAYSDHQLGTLLLAQGDLAGSRKLFQDTLAICRDLGMNSFAAQAEAATAEVDVEQGHAPDGEAPLRHAIAQLENDKDIDDGSRAYALLARLLLSEGKLADAADAAKHATTLAHVTTGRKASFEADLAEARVLAASGHSQEALRRLQALTIAEQRQSFRLHELQTRLVTGEIELQSGMTAPGKTLLAALEKEAAAQGFGLFAAEAHALISH